MGFFSRNLGVRRLALVLALMGGLIGCYGTSWESAVDLQHRRWRQQYIAFETSQGRDPGWDYGHRINVPPEASEYWALFRSLLGGLLLGGVPALLGTHGVAWVIAGFRQGEETAKMRNRAETL